jgi:hypothetical protein
MKIHIDIDCTPEEARTFMGLPDVAPMQEAVMNEMQDRMMAAMRSMDPETLIKTWLPAGISNLEQMQKMFWQQFADPNASKKKERTSDARSCPTARSRATPRPITRHMYSAA